MRRPEALLRLGAAMQGGVENESRRTIGTDGVSPASHVDEDMRVIEGRGRADAHEFPRSNADFRNAGTVVEMGNAVIGHRVSSLFEVARTIKRRRAKR